MCFTDKTKRNWIKKEDRFPDPVRPSGWVRYKGASHHITAVTSLQVVNFDQLVQAAMKIEKSEMRSQERNRERNF